MNYGTYCTPDDLKTRLGITGTTDDADLLRLLVAASRAIDKYCQRHFYLTTETRYYDHPIDSTVLVVDEDLLSVSAITTQNGDSTLSSADYYLMCGRVHNLLPYDRVRMRSDGAITTLSYTDTPQRANAITGEWGYGDGESTTPYTASGATVTLADTTGVSATASAGTAFAVGETILVESEKLYISAIVTTTLTVIRGVNGSTAAAHATKAASIYRYPAEVQEATLMAAARLWGRKHANYSARVGVGELGTIEIEKAVFRDTDIIALLRPYRRWSI